MEEVADASGCLVLWVWRSVPVDKLCWVLTRVLFFGRIEGKKEDHSGIYECVYEANPQIRGQVNVSGNFIYFW